MLDMKLISCRTVTLSIRAVILSILYCRRNNAKKTAGDKIADTVGDNSLNKMNNVKQ